MEPMKLSKASYIHEKSHKINDLFTLFHSHAWIFRINSFNLGAFPGQKRLKWWNFMLVLYVDTKPRRIFPGWWKSRWKYHKVKFMWKICSGKIVENSHVELAKLSWIFPALLFKKDLPTFRCFRPTVYKRHIYRKRNMRKHK